MSSIPSQLLALFWREPGREWTYRELMAELDFTREQLHHPLHRMENEGKIERASRGRYRVNPDWHCPLEYAGSAPESQACSITVQVQRLGLVERQLWALLSPDRPLTARQVACRYGVAYSLAQRHLDALVRYAVADVQGDTYTRRAA